MSFSLEFRSPEFHFLKVDQDSDPGIKALVQRICASQPEYFERVGEQLPQRAQIDEASRALPPGCTLGQKAYGLFYLHDEPLAVFDGIQGFPDPETYFIGLFLIDKSLQGAGLGSRLLRHIENTARAAGFQKLRLGVVEGNEAGYSFWLKNGFAKTATRQDPAGNRWIHLMEKRLVK